MENYIVSGTLLSAIIGLIKGLSDNLFKGLNTVVEHGGEVKDVKENKEDGSLDFEIKTGGDHVLKVHCKPLDERKKRFDVTINEKNGTREFTKENLREKEFEKLFTDIIDRWYGETYEGEVGEKGNQNTQKESTGVNQSIKIGMKKIQNSSTTKLCITSIFCDSLLPDEINEILTDVTNDESFLESIPENKEVGFELIPSEDSINIVELDDTHPSESQNCFIILMSYLKHIEDDMYTIRWNARSDSSKMDSVIGMIEWDIRSNLSCLARWSLEEFNISADCSELSSSNRKLDVTSGYSIEDMKSIISDDIDEFLKIVDIYYCNFCRDIQTQLDIMIRSMKDLKISVQNC